MYTNFDAIKKMSCTSRRVVLIDIIFMSFAVITVFAELVLKPKDAESVVGGSVYFNCSTTDPTKEIQWFHYNPRSPDKDMVYGFDEIRGAYAGRFIVRKNTLTGEFNLELSSVQRQDAGTYECQDEVGLGSKSTAELIVLDSAPVCQSNIKAGEEIIGSNICGMVLDVVHLACSANFHGNLHPVLEWRMVGTSFPITQGVTHQFSDDRVIYNLTIESNLITDGSTFVCQTTKSSSSEQYSCSSDVIRVLTVHNGTSVTEITLGNEAHCPSVNNQSCIYTWTQTEHNDKVSTERLLKPTTPGLYRCEASCFIKNRPCSLFAIVHVTKPADAVPLTASATDDSAESSYKDAFTVVIIVLSIVLVAVAIAAVFLLCRRRKTKSRKACEALSRRQNEEMNHELKVLVDDSEQRLVETATRTEELERLLELAQRQWAGEKDILLRRIEECKKEPVGIEYTSNPILIRTIKTDASLKRGKSIKGIALLNNELFIVSHSESEVEVYDSTTFEFRRRWQLNELSNADDAVSCVRNRCLYISDAKEKSKEILRVDSEGKLITKWQTNNENGRLSVSEEATVVFVVHDSSMLREFSPDGTLLKELNLMSCGVIHPMHAVKLTNGNFVVTQGYVGDAIHKLCEVDTGGMVIKSFGSEKGSGNRQLTNPTYLAIDRDGSIMVADAGNGRVVLLGSNFEFKREIVSKKDGIQIPAKIRLDELNGRLLVGEYKKGNSCLLVYGIK